MDSVDGLLPIVLGIIFIFLINFLVVAKFSFARLRKEHVEDMTILLEKDRQFLLKLYQNPEYFLNTTQFLILFFILALAGTGTYIFNSMVSEIMAVFNFHGTWIHNVLDLLLLLVKLYPKHWVYHFQRDMLIPIVALLLALVALYIPLFGQPVRFLMVFLNSMKQNI